MQRSEITSEIELRKQFIITVINNSVSDDDKESYWSPDYIFNGLNFGKTRRNLKALNIYCEIDQDHSEIDGSTPIDESPVYQFEIDGINLLIHRFNHAFTKVNIDSDSDSNSMTMTEQLINKYYNLFKRRESIIFDRLTHEASLRSKNDSDELQELKLYFKEIFDRYSIDELIRAPQVIRASGDFVCKVISESSQKVIYVNQGTSARDSCIFKIQLIHGEITLTSIIQDVNSLVVDEIDSLTRLLKSFKDSIENFSVKSEVVCETRDYPLRKGTSQIMTPGFSTKSEDPIQQDSISVRDARKRFVGNNIPVPIASHLPRFAPPKKFKPLPEAPTPSETQTEIQNFSQQTNLARNPQGYLSLDSRDQRQESEYHQGYLSLDSRDQRQRDQGQQEFKDSQDLLSLPREDGMQNDQLSISASLVLSPAYRTQPASIPTDEIQELPAETASHTDQQNSPQNDLARRVLDMLKRGKNATNFPPALAQETSIEMTSPESVTAIVGYETSTAQSNSIVEALDNRPNYTPHTTRCSCLLALKRCLGL